MFSRFMQIVACNYFIPFLLHIESSYGYIVFCYSLINKRTFGLCPVLAIISHAALNSSVQVFVKMHISNILGIYHGVKLLSYMIILCLTSWGTDTLYLKVTIPFYITNSNEGGIGFLHIMAALTSVCHFDFILAILVGVVLYIIFLMTNNVEHFSICLLAIWIFFLEKYPLISFADILIRLSVILLLNCKSSSYIQNTCLKYVTQLFCSILWCRLSHFFLQNKIHFLFFKVYCWAYHRCPFPSPSPSPLPLPFSTRLMPHPVE